MLEVVGMDRPEYGRWGPSTDGEEWQGLTVRVRDGAVVGVVVGVFPDGSLAGRLRVEGEHAAGRWGRGPRDGVAVSAIPRRAVVRRRRRPSLAGSNMVDITQVRKGMEIHAADGIKLGKIAEVWVGTDPVDSTTQCDEETCSRLEVHQRVAPCISLTARSPACPARA
jgi:hypothetical protein